MSIFIETSVRDKLRAKLSPVAYGLPLQIASIVGAFAVICSLQMPQLSALKHQSDHLTEAEIQREQTRAKAQFSLVKILPAFGFDNLVANWYFMDFLQYFGDDKVRKKAGYGVAMDYFDVILDRDPRFLYAYYYLSNTGSLYAGEPERSVSLMNQGLKSLSPQVPDRGYYIWRLKAVDELLFLGRIPDAQKSMLTASLWARQNSTAEAQNVAKISQNTAAYLSRNPNSKQAQFDAWNMVLTAAVDKSVVDRAIAQIRAIGGKVTTSPTGQFQVIAPAQD